MRAASSAWIVGGVRTAGSSARIATSCSRKSGFPSAAYITSSRLTFARRRVGQAAEQARRIGVGQRLEPDDAAASRPRPPTPAAARAGRRARRRRSARAPVACAATCSIRSSIAGSAQWMSSNAATSGPRRASASKSRRTAHWTSTSVALTPASPAAAATRDATACGWESPDEEVLDLGHAGGPRQVVHDLDQRPVGDALAVRKAAADDDASPPSSIPAMNSLRIRDLPIPAGPVTVTSTQRSRSTARRKRVFSIRSSARRPTSGTADPRV